jgi:Xaa-Pro aminopeptidase
MIVTALRDKAVTERRVAMETGMNETLFMPNVLFEQLKATFPRMEIESAHKYVMEVQAVKSAEETAALRAACEISTKAFEKGFEAVREGRTEQEISSAIKAEMLRMGAEKVPFLTVIAGWGGRSICCDSHPTEYRIRKGDVIQFDGGCAVKGYCADMCRTGALATVGNPRYLELYEAAKEAHRTVRAVLRDGAPIRDVCAAGREYFVGHGYKDLMVFGEGQTGHGIGMDLHQPPFLLYDSPDVLKEGMTVAIEPALSERPLWDDSSYFTILENNYLITADGCEQLTTSDEEIRVV